MDAGPTTATPSEYIAAVQRLVEPPAQLASSLEERGRAVTGARAAKRPHRPDRRRRPRPPGGVPRPAPGRPGAAAPARPPGRRVRADDPAHARRRRRPRLRRPRHAVARLPPLPRRPGRAVIRGRRLLVVALSAALAAGVAGCGGGSIEAGTSSVPDGTQVSSQRYLADTAAAADAVADFSALLSSLAPEPRPAQLRAAAADLAAARDRAALLSARLRAERLRGPAARGAAGRRLGRARRGRRRDGRPRRRRRPRRSRRRGGRVQDVQPGRRRAAEPARPELGPSGASSFRAVAADGRCARRSGASGARSHDQPKGW